MRQTRLARTSLSSSLLLVTTALCATSALAATTPAVVDFRTCAKPEWPKEALRKEQQGKVTLAYLIDESGAVTDSKIVQSSGFPMLDMAARDGIIKCRFTPSTREGKPQAAWMKMQYVWTLQRTATDPAVLAERFEADREAAEAGDAAAAFRVAQRYLSSTGGSRDPEKGTWWLRKAADGGNAEATELLAWMLFQGIDLAQDKEDAVRWIEQAAEQGSANAQAILGMLLLSGNGVTRDEAAGEEWLVKAAQQEYPQAQAQLAALRMRRGSVDADTIAMLERAAGRNDPLARVVLARCYQQGTGVGQDQAKAFALYARAAASGNAEARRALADLYDKGIGLPEDRLAAAMVLGRSGAAKAGREASRAAAGQ
ncbi:TonB family protein [Pseudoduganella sp. SL102]|uniref:TonB family protein n=1 Tax=Pseudoduganella sp. SL102 TaxID=2995154 RepID=UPI00248C10C3|nr:TonB family protein [Pseudoduganella sp. SL102]WBS03505.1 TonB family protein [Pseudoduganella sp. SL102]